MLGNYMRRSTTRGNANVSVNWEYLYPCEVAARGEVQEKSIGWRTKRPCGGSITSHKVGVLIAQLASATTEHSLQ